MERRSFPVLFEHPKGMAMDDAGADLLVALGALVQVADRLPPRKALGTLTTADLEVFWREWPEVSTWAGSLWSELDHDLADPARMQLDPELDEVGEGG
jgi:hypothetical protein